MAFRLASNREGREAIPEKKNMGSALASTNETAARRISRTIGRKPVSPLPVIGKLPVAKQLQILLIGFGILLVIAGIVIFVDYRAATNSTTYVATAGEMRMLSQRLSKATQTALTGSAGGFKQLAQSRTQFKDALDLLLQGGIVSGAPLPPTSDAVMPTLEALGKVWETIDRNLAQVLRQQRNLIRLGTAVHAINGNNAALLKLTEEVLALKLQANAPGREISQIAHMVMLTQRLAKNANALLGSEAVDEGVAQLMDRDVNLFSELVSALQKGSDALKISATRDPETVQKLAQLQKVLAESKPAFVAIVSGLKGLASAKQAAGHVVADSDALFDATEKLTRAYRAEIGAQVYFWILVIVVLLGIGVVWLMVKAYVDDQRRLAQDAERQREEVERQNRANQEAILRLMDEMQAVAGGDLTVKATVSEDMTGVIADSVNFTIEELRVLVGRINSAATEVAAATGQAERTSTQLLAAADYQSRQIQETSSSVLKMADAMNNVMASTSQSANVARQSLSAAQKGTQAVQNAIAGMNDIRDQIQDTSKRIKRLGESSQEIGEIVELISDITEQTNVLALNAAIQAASAGEAGRGFTVVAEEVQRLAERSAEATKQIGAIVKTIQTDTQDAVSAMEKSTRGVVDGAILSDAAGQALAEIGEVSQRLSARIEAIAEAIQNQTNNATKVAGSMQEILRITQQTTDGTKRTATSIEQLALLAKELKGSVSRFRMD